MQRRGNKIAQEGNESENRQQAIDHTWHSCQQFNDESKSFGQARRRELGEKNRGTDSKRNADNQGEHGSDQSPINERQSAEFQRDGIPRGARQETPSEFCSRQSGAGIQLIEQKSGNEEDRCGEKKSDEVSDLIAAVESLPRGAGAPGGTRTRGDSGRLHRYSIPEIAFCSIATTSLGSRA